MPADILQDVRFEVSHALPADPATVAEALLDADYQASLDGIGGLSERRVESQERADDGSVVRRIHCVLGVSLPSAAQRFLGEAKPSWTEEAKWQPDDMRWDWTIVPDSHANLISARGVIELLPEGAHTARRVGGDVRVKVPLYGGKVERVIVDHLEKAYAAEAQRLRKWLAAKG